MAARWSISIQKGRKARTTATAGRANITNQRTQRAGTERTQTLHPTMHQTDTQWQSCARARPRGGFDKKGAVLRLLKKPEQDLPKYLKY